MQLASHHIIIWFIVKELETADPERCDEILNLTFEERRGWVTTDNGPKITEVMETYPVFHTNLEQVSCMSGNKELQELSTQHQWRTSVDRIYIRTY